MRMTHVLLSAIVMLAIFFSHPVLSGARSYTIDDTTIHAFILPDGDVYVEELFTYSFDGKYNGTTRTIGDDKFDGLQFFNAYEAPLEMTFDTYDSDQLTTLHVEQDKYTFKAYDVAEDEQKNIHYRYRIKNAARKYKDVGEFYWRFFDSMNESDIHHLDIHFFLLDPDTNKSIPLPGDARGFVHDLHGGSFDLQEYDLHYTTDLLPANTWAEQRLIFPADFLSEMNVTDPVMKRDRILKQEASFSRQQDRLEKWLPTINSMDTVFLVLFSLLLLFAIFFPRRIIRLFKGRGEANIIDRLDSLTVVALNKRLRFRYTDINAALFTMYQEGNIHIRKSQEDEGKSTFIYVLDTSAHYLKEHEQFLVNWLFTKTGDNKQAFSLDQIPLRHPEASDRERYQASENYRVFRKKWKEWRKLVKKDATILRMIKPVFMRKILLFGILPFWFLWGCFHLFVSVQFQSSLNNYLAVFAVMCIWLLPFVGNFQIERLYTPFYLTTLLVMAHILEMDSRFDIFYTAHLILILCALMLPSTYPTMEGIDYKKGIRKWEKLLKTASLPIDTTNPASMEKSYQHAISLENGDSFYQYYLQDIEVADYPLLIAPEDTNYLYRTVFIHRFSSSGGGSTSSGGGGSGGGGGAGAF